MKKRLEFLKHLLLAGIIFLVFVSIAFHARNSILEMNARFLLKGLLDSYSSFQIYSDYDLRQCGSSTIQSYRCFTATESITVSSLTTEVCILGSYSFQSSFAPFPYISLATYTNKINDIRTFINEILIDCTLIELNDEVEDGHRFKVVFAHDYFNGFVLYINKETKLIGKVKRLSLWRLKHSAFLEQVFPPYKWYLSRHAILSLSPYETESLSNVSTQAISLPSINTLHGKFDLKEVSRLITPGWHSANDFGIENDIRNEHISLGELAIQNEGEYFTVQDRIAFSINSDNNLTQSDLETFREKIEEMLNSGNFRVSDFLNNESGHSGFLDFTTELKKCLPNPIFDLGISYICTTRFPK